MKTIVTFISGIMIGIFGWNKVVRYVNKHDPNRLHEILDKEME